MVRKKNAQHINHTETHRAKLGVQVAMARERHKLERARLLNNNNSTDERMIETHVQEMQLNKMRVVELKDICTVYKISHYRTKKADLIARIGMGESGGDECRG